MNSKDTRTKKFISVEEYVNTCFNTFKLKHPKLTKRQIHIQLQNQWQNEQKKSLSMQIKKNQPIINQHDENEEIYIPIEALNNETQIKTNKKDNINRKSTKKNKQKSQNLHKLIKNNSDPSQQSLDINSLEERVSNIQIDVVNLSKTQPSRNLINQQINIKNEQDQNNQSKKNNKKQQKVTFKQLKKISQTIDCENPPDEKPIPIQDFINSANFIDHISIINISKNKTNQGQIEIDKIKSIVSHTYGLVNHKEDTSNLKLQLFFQVEFHPRENETYPPDNTFCTAKQAALYNKDLVLDYLNKNKNIFTQNCEYYIK